MEFRGHLSEGCSGLSRRPSRDSPSLSGGPAVGAVSACVGYLRTPRLEPALDKKSSKKKKKKKTLKAP